MQCRKMVQKAFYLFAVLAVFLFRDNDPGHFGDLAITIISLFRCSTLDDWTDLMYLNMLGCDEYDAGLYIPAEKPHRFPTHMGSYYGFTCASPNGKGAIAALFFLAFTVVSSFVVLSLFIGAITLSMSEVLDEQLKERKHTKIAAIVTPEWLWDVVTKALGDKKIDESDFGNNENRTIPLHFRGHGHKVSCTTPELMKSFSSFNLGFDSSFKGQRTKIMTSWTRKYLRVSLMCRRVSHSPKFEAFMTATICLAGVLVGVSTIVKADWINGFDSVILLIFTAEFFIKLLAQGRKPLRYFADPWNRFDITILICLYIPMVLGNNTMSSLVSIFRLARVLKLLQAFKQLRIVVEALFKGFQSITYISVMMFLIFFMFAIVGMILFKENDPWHFGLLQDALLTMFRCATLEDWSDVMYINMWGCDRYGYGDWPELCKSPVAWGWLATVYFIVFAVIGSMVLVTLFLGVVTTSMEQAGLRQKMEDELQDEIKVAVNKHRITDYGVRLLYNAYALLDEDEGGTLEYDELKPMLSAVSPEFTDRTFKLIFNKVDADRSGEIDFAEFIELMILIKQWAVDHDQGDSGVCRKGTFPINASGTPPGRASRRGSTIGNLAASLGGLRRSSTVKKIDMAKLADSLFKRPKVHSKYISDEDVPEVNRPSCESKRDQDKVQELFTKDSSSSDSVQRLQEPKFPWNNMDDEDSPFFKTRSKEDSVSSEHSDCPLLLVTPRSSPTQQMMKRPLEPGLIHRTSTASPGFKRAPVANGPLNPHEKHKSPPLGSAEESHGYSHTSSVHSFPLLAISGLSSQFTGTNSCRSSQREPSPAKDTVCHNFEASEVNFALNEEWAELQKEGHTLMDQIDMFGKILESLTMYNLKMKDEMAALGAEVPESVQCQHPLAGWKEPRREKGPCAETEKLSTDKECFSKKGDNEGSPQNQYFANKMSGKSSLLSEETHRISWVSKSADKVPLSEDGRGTKMCLEQEKGNSFCGPVCHVGQQGDQPQKKQSFMRPILSTHSISSCSHTLDLLEDEICGRRIDEEFSLDTLTGRYPTALSQKESSLVKACENVVIPKSVSSCSSSKGDSSVDQQSKNDSKPSNISFPTSRY